MKINLISTELKKIHYFYIFKKSSNCKTEEDNNG